MAQGLETESATKQARVTQGQPLSERRAGVGPDKDGRTIEVCMPPSRRPTKRHLRGFSAPSRLSEVGEAQAIAYPAQDVANVDLLSLLAHQLMTPLTLIDSAAQRMVRGGDKMDPREIKARAERILCATARLSGLVHSLLERAKLGNQRIVAKQDCDWADLMSEACEHIRCSQPSRRFVVTGTGDRAAFEGDPLLLEQLCLILVSNAAKYSPPESTIEIAGHMTSDALIITVMDHGIGIPSNDVPRLFQPFFRSSNAASFSGTGLGLSLAEQIVRLHGGSIAVQSREDEGTTFTVTLPRSERRTLAVAKRPA